MLALNGWAGLGAIAERELCVRGNFSIAGTSHIRNWKWASTAGPVLRTLSVIPR